MDKVISTIIEKAWVEKKYANIYVKVYDSMYAPYVCCVL